MQCPVTGEACETPRLCGSQGCIMVEMSTPTDPNFQGRQAPPEMRKRDKIRRLMEKSKGRNA
jgi:hypothetical protein